MKRIFALLIAALVLLSSFAALADEIDYSNPGAPYAGDTQWDTEFAGVKDGTLTVGGLLPGDTVKFYRVLAFDEKADTKVADLNDESKVTDGAQGWKVIAPFDTAIIWSDLQAILTTGITDELAGKIAKKATGKADYTGVVADEATAVTVPDEGAVEDGLYVAIVVPAKAGWMFNPIFVSSDYYKTGDTDKSSTWEADTDLSYSNEAMAKKSPITVTKEATEGEDEDDNETDDAKAVAKGDTIHFTITTTIPEFADNYTEPKFVVVDTMTSGLALDDGTIKVYEEDGETEIKATDDSVKQFTLTVTGTTQYSVDFDPDYLLNLDQAKPIVIKYDATVTENATENLHEEDNTVTVEYSHEPSITHDGTGKKVGDKTHHYSFTIDGDIWGSSQTWTEEVVKIGLDKDGNEITQTSTLINGKQIGALKGAEFKLYTDEELQKEYDKEPYKTAGKIVSLEDGRLSLDGTTSGIPGLDAGTFYLVETKAPAGYIKQQAPVKIEILPTFYGEVTWTEDGIEYSCDDIMKSYTVEVDDNVTATYTLKYEEMNEDNSKPLNDHTKEDNNNMLVGHVITIGNEGPITKEEPTTTAVGKIKNTQGVELPSTGGIGTTLFYIGGSILVLAAVILLVTKRRMGGND